MNSLHSQAKKCKNSSFSTHPTRYAPTQVPLPNESPLGLVDVPGTAAHGPGIAPSPGGHSVIETLQQSFEMEPSGFPCVLEEAVASGSCRWLEPPLPCSSYSRCEVDMVSHACKRKYVSAPSVWPVGAGCVLCLWPLSPLGLLICVLSCDFLLFFPPCPARRHPMSSHFCGQHLLSLSSPRAPLTAGPLQAAMLAVPGAPSFFCACPLPRTVCGLLPDTSPLALCGALSTSRCAGW